MRIAIAICALLALTSFAAESFRHAPSGIECPPEIAGFALNGVQEYEAEYPGQGVSCTYIAQTAPYGADIFIFNNGLRSVPSDITNPAFVQLRERTLKDIEQSARNHGESSRVADQAVLNVDTARGPVPVYYDALIITSPTAARTTWVWLWPARNHFVKIRMTRPTVGSLSPRRAREFSEAVVKLTTE